MTDKIGRESWVSMGLMLSLLVGTAVVSGWGSRIESRLEHLEEAVRGGTNDRWTGSNMRAWVHAFDDAVEVWSLQFEGQFPGVTIERFEAPDPDDYLAR